VRSSRAEPGRDNDRAGAVRSAVPSRLVAALGLAASLVAGFGVIDLVTALAPGPEWEALRMLEAGWGIVFGLVIPIALALQITRGAGPVAAVQQLVVVTMSLALATLATAKAREWLLVGVLTVFTAVVIALHPARSRVLRAGGSPDRALAALALLAAVPAGVYAARMAANRRHGLIGDDTLGFEHWTVQSALPVCLVLLLALSAAKTDGWRVPAASAAIGSVTLGAIAIMAGDVPANVGTGWAIATIAWGALVGLLAITRSPTSDQRRDRPKRQASSATDENGH
jgi:hypothetical protein